LENQPLQLKYPRLYSLLCQGKTIIEVVSWGRGNENDTTRCS